jgi:hypothetical protein
MSTIAEALALLQEALPGIRSQKSRQIAREGLAAIIPVLTAAEQIQAAQAGQIATQQQLIASLTAQQTTQQSIILSLTQQLTAARRALAELTRSETT